MTRLLQLAAAGLLALAPQAASQAATVSRFTGDVTFNEICALGDAIGAGNQACEFAVAEIRSGNGALNGDWEVGVQSPPGTPVATRQVAHVNGQAEPFELRYTATTGAISFIYALGRTTEVTSSATLGPGGLDDMRSMFIRVRDTRDAATNPATVELADLALTRSANTVAIGSLGSAGAGSANAGYALISGFDFGGDWTLTGTAKFAWAATRPNGSGLNVNFKLTDYAPPATVPLPPALLLLAGAVAGLGLLRRAA